MILCFYFLRGGENRRITSPAYSMIFTAPKFLTFRLAQVLTRYGCFERFLFRIRWDDTPGCHHCVERPKDTVEHTVEVCPTWTEYRRVLLKTIGGSDLSRPPLVEAMVRRGAEASSANVTSFCEAVMQAVSDYYLLKPCLFLLLVVFQYLFPFQAVVSTRTLSY